MMHHEPTDEESKMTTFEPAPVTFGELSKLLSLPRLEPFLEEASEDPDVA